MSSVSGNPPAGQSQLGGAIVVHNLLPNSGAAFLSALVTLSYSISYGTLIFSHRELEQFVPVGIQVALMSAWIIALVVAVGSSFNVSIAGPDSNATAILSVMAGGIATQLHAAGVAPYDILATVLAMLLLSAVFIGAVAFSLGASKRGSLIRYLPYSVMGGFLAGTGYLILAGAYSVLVGEPLSLGSLLYKLPEVPFQKWVPAVFVALTLLIVPRFTKSYLLMPVTLVLGILIFYTCMLASGVTPDDARASGMLFPPLKSASLSHPAFTHMPNVHWDVLAGQWDNMLALTLVVIVTILLNATALDLATQRDVNIDRELRVNGIANLISGLLGGLIGYVSISRSLLNHKAGAVSRGSGIITAIICLVAAFFAAPLLSYFPRPVLAGLLLFLALSLLREWIWEAYFKLPWLEFVLIVAILILVAFKGIITGVAFGILVASIIFVYSYSRTSCIKYAFTSAERFSNKERSREKADFLSANGGSARTLALQGYLFFGTASAIVETMRTYISPVKERPDNTSDFAMSMVAGAPSIVNGPLPQATLTHLQLDFRRVQGVDISAVLSFHKLDQLCKKAGARLILSGLSPEIEAELKRAGFLPRDGVTVVEDMDIGMERMEDELLALSGFVVHPVNVESGTRRNTMNIAEMDLRRILSEEFSGPELDTLISYCETQKPEAFTPLFKRGEPGDSLFFIERGELAVMLPLADGRSKRLRAFGPGTIVGEMGVYTGHARSADVIASDSCRVRKLTQEALSRLEKERPDVAIKFHRFVAKLLALRLSAANTEIRTLS